MSAVLVRCNQCIKTLLLSYQTSLSEDFHLSPTKAIFEEEKNAHMPEIGSKFENKNILGNSRAKGMQ